MVLFGPEDKISRGENSNKLNYHHSMVRHNIGKWVKIASPFIIIVMTSLTVHWPSLSYYFLQDDWFVLNWVKTEDLASFFLFRTDIIYWRPLSMPLLFSLSYKAFGLNPVGFHLIGFSIFIILIACVYKLILLLSKNAKLALLGAFLYATWHIHYMSLSWFSTTSYLLGPLLNLLSFIFFILFIKKSRKKLYFASLLFFVLSFLTSEFALVVPLVLFSWGIILERKNYIKYLLPYFVLDAIFVFLRFIVFPIPAEDSYKISLNSQVITNYAWYILWAFNFPESFKDLVILQQPKNSLKVLGQFWLIAVPAFILMALIIYRAARTAKKNANNYLFGFMFLTLGLLPVLTTVNHSYAVYLSLGGIGFILIILKALEKSHNSFLAAITIIWLFTNLQTLNFNRFTHWITNEQAIAKAYVTLAKNKFAQPFPHSYLIIRPPDVQFAAKNNFVVVNNLGQIKQALNDEDALKVIYNDESLHTVYVSHKDKVPIPKNAPVYTIDPGL